MAPFDPPATRDWDFPRNVAGVGLLVSEGVDAGLDQRALLTGTDLRAADLTDHQREVTAGQELRVVRNLLAGAPGSRGVDVGARYHASTFGALGFALISSATLGDAANLALRFLDLSFTFTIPSATVDGDQVVVHVDDRGLPADVRRFLVERDLAAIWTVLRELGDGEPVARSVTLPFPAAAPTAYRRVFGVVPAWDGDRTALRFDAAWLERPLAQADPHARALAEQLCADLVAGRRRTDRTVAHARVLVAQTIERGAPMTAVAAALGLSERSLRRRLTAAGTSYRAVVDDVRRTLARDLLATDTLTVEDVAARLGYAEASSLIVAHRRWTGQTPRR